MLLVILTLALQSIHIYIHQHRHIENEHLCDGDHDHQSHEDCFVCDFVFSFFVGQPVFFHPFPKKLNPQISVCFILNEPTFENLHAQPKRGPPVV